MTKIHQSLRELDQTLKQVKGHFLYSKELSHRIIGMLNEEALMHSDKLEPDCNHKRTLVDLQDAWKYAKEEFNGTLDEGFIRRVAGRIHLTAFAYRTSSAMVQRPGQMHMMTNPAKVEREVGKLLDQYRTSKEHPAFKAVEFNMHFLFIHPFEDGNVRTGRLLQNLLLHQEGIPPVVIPHTTRLTYLRHLDDALIAFKARGGQEERFTNYSGPEQRFFEYELDLVKTAADKLEQKIGRQRKYEVEVGVAGKGALFTVKKLLYSSLNRDCTVSSVHLEGGRISVVTSAPEEVIVGVLETYRRKHNSALQSYDIRRIEK